MHRITIVTVGLIFAGLALTGCESRQHKLQRLQAEYAAAYKQYQIDCVEPMSNGAADALTYVPRTTGKSAAKSKATPDEEKKRTKKCQADDAKTERLQQQILDATNK